MTVPDLAGRRVLASGGSRGTGRAVSTCWAATPGAALFLASDASSSPTGAVLRLDGGAARM